MKKKTRLLNIIMICILCFLLSGLNAEAASRHATIKQLLQTGLKPVGSTLYIWGGGWGANGASKEAKTIGVSASWKKFYKKQKKGYNYQNYRYQSSKGLDCSGYIGWCIYNIMETKNGKKGYVMYAENMAKNFAKRGWGRFTSRTKVKTHQAGDIMSLPSGHVIWWWAPAKMEV